MCITKDVIDDLEEERVTLQERLKQHIPGTDCNKQEKEQQKIFYGQIG